MDSTYTPPSLGIIGGLGPLASLHSLQSIYQFDFDHERNAPQVVLLSLPMEQNIKSEMEWREKFSAKIGKDLELLNSTKVNTSLLCCYTAHSVADDKWIQNYPHLIQLPKFALQHSVRFAGKTLILCSLKSKKNGVFDRQPVWNQLREKFTFPPDRHQEQVEEAIQNIKKKNNADAVKILSAVIDDAIKTPGISNVLLGCTELPLVKAELAK